MYIKAIAGFLLFISQVSLSQAQEGLLHTDRPGQANCPYTVGVGVAQLQAGIERNRLASGGLLLETNFSPSVYGRYGVLKNLEINANVGLTNYRSRLFPSGFSNDFGINSFQIGTRVDLMNDPAKKYAAAVQLNLSLRAPVIGALRPDNSFPTALLLFGTQLDDKLSLTVNLGSRYTDLLRFDLLYVVNLSYAYNDKTSIFVETYGELQKSSVILFDGGVGYLINNNFQLDISGGLARNYNENSAFISAGISYRFLPNK
jgi:hypothetical protein